MSKMQTHTLAASAGITTTVTMASKNGAGKIVDAETFHSPQVGGAIVLANEGKIIAHDTGDNETAGFQSV
jgi:hypothetical protein